jgi:hypothetical protein
MEKLAAYEDAEEQGRLVVMPYRYGDRVWLVEFDECDEPYDISGYQFVGCCNDVGYLAPSYNGDSSLECILHNLLQETEESYHSDITVAYLHNIYATRAEAEAVLQNKEGGEEA